MIVCAAVCSWLADAAAACVSASDTAAAFVSTSDAAAASVSAADATVDSDSVSVAAATSVSVFDAAAASSPHLAQLQPLFLPEADSKTLNGYNSTQSSPQKLSLDRFYTVSCALSDGGLRGPWKPPKMLLKKRREFVRSAPPKAWSL